MNKFFPTVAALLFCTNLQAATINNLTAGALKDAGIPSTETNLTISGEMNAADFSYILDNLINLEALNISNAVIVAYDAEELPYTKLSASPANTLPDYALTGLSNLRVIQLPKTLKAVGTGSLSGTGVVELKLPGSVASIGNYAAMRCENLTTLEIPKSITEIGTRAFANCPRLNVLALYATLPTLPEGIFEACGGLKTVNLNNLANCQEIGAWAFAECNGLETLVLPEKTTTLSDGALYGTSKIPFLSLPAGVDYLGSQAMGSMTALNTLLVNELEAIPELGDNVWSNVNQSDVTLVTPNNQVAEYQAADQWKNFTIMSEDDWMASSDTPTVTVGEPGMHVKIQGRQLTVSAVTGSLGNVALFNASGQRVMFASGAESVSFQISSLPKGVYLVVSNLGVAKISL